MKVKERIMNTKDKAVNFIKANKGKILFGIGITAATGVVLHLRNRVLTDESYTVTFEDGDTYTAHGGIEQLEDKLEEAGVDPETVKIED